MNKIERQIARDKKLDELYKMVEKILELLGEKHERDEGKEAKKGKK